MTIEAREILDVLDKEDMKRVEEKIIQQVKKSKEITLEEAVKKSYLEAHGFEY